MNWTAPWDLRQRGQKDAQRHRERVHEAIRENLHHLIIEEAIISSQGDRKVKVPIKYLTHYHFRYGENWRGVGSGQGEVGDVIGKKGQRDGDGSDGRAGDQPGDAVYEAEVTFDDLVKVMLEDLNLPWLERTPQKDLPTEDIVFQDVRRQGQIHNLDKRRSLLENMKRQASRGEVGVGPWHEHDLRYRVWQEQSMPSSRAAVYMLMDRSGSMTTEKRYIAKGFFFWLTRFLKLKYNRVEMVFIAHDVRADIVSEQEFFTIAAGGGTRCSSAYTLARHHMKQVHPPASWNNYVFHFTDGDNIPADNDTCRDLVGHLLQMCNMVGYGEIAYGHYGTFFRSSATSSSAIGMGDDRRKRSRLYATLSDIENDRLILTRIDHRDEIYRGLQDFLKVTAEAQRSVRAR